MLGELEAAVVASLRHFGGGHAFQPAPGSICANCDAPLQGRYCYVCGQDADTHKRSILHLAWEGVEGLFHLDGRLLRTLPALFFQPGKLARDYMENRIARHVPPFRTFLVALLLFVFAAEHVTHQITETSVRQHAEREAAKATPAGRASLAAGMRKDADRDRAGDLAEAARDRANNLREPDAHRADVKRDYAREIARVQARYVAQQARADHVAAGLPDEDPDGLTIHTKASGNWWHAGLRKAQANPEYYLTVLFTWAHRAAFLLLPIVGLSLAAVYAGRKRYFLYDHLLVAMNLLSFAFLTNAFGLILPSPLMGWWLLLVAIWTPVNLFQTLRGAYGSTIVGAVLKTLFVWLATVFAFSALITGLVIFTLTQL